MYAIKLHREIEKQLARFPKPDQKRLASAIRNLGQAPRPPGCVNLREMLYRVRIGHYRVIYAVFDEVVVIVVVKISRRSEATYRDLGALIERAERLLDN